MNKKTTTNITEISLEVLPSKVPLLEVLLSHIKRPDPEI